LIIPPPRRRADGWPFFLLRNLLAVSLRHHALMVSLSPFSWVVGVYRYIAVVPVFPSQILVAHRGLPPCSLPETEFALARNSPPLPSPLPSFFSSSLLEMSHYPRRSPTEFAHPSCTLRALTSSSQLPANRQAPQSSTSFQDIPESAVLARRFVIAFRGNHPSSVRLGKYGTFRIDHFGFPLWSLATKRDLFPFRSTAFFCLLLRSSDLLLFFRSF